MNPYGRTPWNIGVVQHRHGQAYSTVRIAYLLEDQEDTEHGCPGVVFFEIMDSTLLREFGFVSPERTWHAQPYDWT